MKEILIKSPNNGEDRVLVARSCHKMKFPVRGVGYIQMSFWPNGSHGNLQTTQAVAKTMLYSPQTEGKCTLMKTTPTQLIEHGEVELAPE